VGRRKIGTMIKTIGILLILIFSCFCFACYALGLHNQITQYIVTKNDKKLQPYAKVIYKIYVDRQEVVYWVESPGKDRSQLYKLKKCIIADSNNWEGEADYILLWKIGVRVVNGKFGYLGEGLANVSWFEWHFRTDPKPSHLTDAVVGFVGIIVFVIIFIWAYREWKKWKSGKQDEKRNPA